MSYIRPLALFATLLALVLCTCLVGSCQPAGDQAPRTAATEADVALNELAQDIDLLYTINRLDLQAAQMQPLLGLAAQVQQEQAKLEPQRQAAIAGLIPLLREKRTLLLQDKELPEELDGKIQAAQGKLNEIEESLAQASVKLVPDLRKVLTADQISILTGEDEARAQAVELLEWIRELPAGDYAEEAGGNAEELADPDQGLPAAAIMKVFDEARKLSAADFSKKQGALADKLAPLYMPMPEAADDALLQFFSSPRLEAVLKERAAGA